MNRLREDIRSGLEMGFSARQRFSAIAQTEEYRRVFKISQPKVSICIATYNRAKLLRERALASALSQTYPNIEIIVVGDQCTDETEQMFAGIHDARVKFVNLPRRGDYPSDSYERWTVAGTKPMNHALSLTSGDFVTHLDDDDEHAPDRIEKLVQFAQSTESELIYHPFRYEKRDAEWAINKAQSFGFGLVTTSSIFYHRWLSCIGWDIAAYRYREPGDWNRLRKFRYLGVRTARYPEVLLTHYREHNQNETRGAV